MPYHFKHSETVAEAVKRIARGELTAASEELAGKNGHSRDEGIHEARKSVKKVRALLRLMRDELGPVYRTANVRLRGIGRKLSDFRDTQSIVEISDSLQKKYRGQLTAPAFKSIRGGLLASKKQAESRGNIDHVLARMALNLARAAEHIDEWALERDGFAAIEPGLEKCFRAGRKAFRYALKHPTAENFHEWRKRLKDQWYHIRLLEDLWTDVLQGYEKTLKELQNCLGDDHNLVVLREKIVSDPAAFGSTEQVEQFCTLIDGYQAELRKNAAALGRPLYEEKPREFTRRMKHLWEAWQRKPDKVDAVQSDHAAP